MVALSSYYASVGIKVDDKALKDVDRYLKRIEDKLSKVGGKKGLQVNLFVDEAKFHKHLQGVLNRAGKSSPFKLSNVTIDSTKLVASVREVFSKAQFKAPISATISKASLQTIRSQVQAALQGITIGVRTGSVAPRSSSGGQGTGSVSAQRRASLTGRGDPSLQEFLMGKPDRSSLSAGNRRYLDAIVGKTFGGVGGNSLTGMAIQGGFGGLARAGGSSFLGRAAGMAGMALGGPFGGAMGLVGSGVISLAGQAFTGIWSTLGKVITLPFQAISGAASMVTGAFYRLALAAAPLVIGFNAIDKRVREKTTQGVALNAAATEFGSTGKAERNWLMNMANKSGVEYGNLVDPFTTFISASAPAMGLSQSKGIFEALTQYGATHGANNFSMQNAMKAFGQMSAKGTVQLEELKNQVGDAQGFGGMMPIFAEAWQQLQGKTGSNKLTGQKALDELLKATEKRQVIAAKILPLVEKIAREKSAGAIEARVNSSEGQRALFMNQLDAGWQNFTDGGGESGLKFFWQMMQRMGSWWISNGAALGRAFETTMMWLNVFRLGIMELSQFLYSGKHNSFTDWARSLGIDVDTIRDSLLRLRDSILKLLGIDSTNVTTILNTIIDRLIQFVNRLSEIADGANRAVKGLNETKEATLGKNQKYMASDFWGKTSMFTREALSYLPMGRIFTAGDPTITRGIKNIIGGTSDATTSAAGALTDLATGSGNKPVYLPPSVPTWKPEGWGTKPADMNGSIMRKEVPTSTTQNVNVKVTIDGSADILGLIDKTQLYTYVAGAIKTENSKEYSSALPGAPIQR